MGLRPFQVAEATGYTLVRISILRKDPAFQDLVARYAADVNDEWKQEVSGYYENLNKVRDITARMMLDQLVDADEVGEILPLRQLAGIHSDAADRTGFGKRSTQVNVNVDFAAQLDRAIQRSRRGESPEELKVVVDASPRNDLLSGGTPHLNGRLRRI